MSTDRCALLIVDDELHALPGLAEIVGGEFAVVTASSAEAAQQIFQKQAIDLILSDQKLPGMGGVELLEWVRQQSPRTIRILMTGYAELDHAVEAINRSRVYYYLLKPWRMEELLKVLHNAAEKFRLERNREQLLDELHKVNLELEERVQHQTQALEEANQQLQFRLHELETLALTDPLTGLLNRRAVDEVIRAELRRHARYGSPLALGLIDADNFREINRRYLYPGGDQVLIHLAKTLTSSLRTVDSVGRIGGEEFLVVAPETGTEGALVLAERIRGHVELKPACYKDTQIAVTVSVGFAVAEAGVEAEFDQIKHVAATALGEAKTAGRNRSVVLPM